MELDAAIQTILDNPGDEDHLRQLTDADVSVIVERLKARADEHWNIDPNVSLVYADAIIRIGQARHATAHVALGTMARGDALKFLGHFHEAWDALEEAGNLFLSIPDEIGWARTRIGRLFIGAQLNRLGDVLADAQTARDIFTHCGEWEKLLRLEWNTGFTYMHVGEPNDALRHFQSALEVADRLGTSGDYYRSSLQVDIGYCYETLGDLREALNHFERAYQHFTGLGETRAIAITRLNIANIAFVQGRYHHALNLLYQIEQSTGDYLPLEYIIARRLVVECYLSLNRFQEARELASQLVVECQAQGVLYEAGYTLHLLGLAEAELGDYKAALSVLDEAQAVYTQTNAATWIATIGLQRGWVAFRQGDLMLAGQEAQAVGDYFRDNGQQVSYARAALLQGELACAERQFADAVEAARMVLGVARRTRVPQLQYSAHALLGRVARAQDERRRAIRHYSAAARAVERLHRSLTITLRAGFLHSREEPHRELVRLYLDDKRIDCAFEVLERIKSQALFHHLTNREDLRWLTHDAHSQALIAELEAARLDHHALFQLAYGDMPPGKDPPDPARQEAAAGEMAACERRMRNLAEKLYLHGSPDSPAAPLPSLGDIQDCLDADSLLIAFYNDGQRLWAFAADRGSLTVHALPDGVSRLDAALNQIHFDIACALKAGPNASTARRLTAITRRGLHALYESLLEPLAPRLQPYRRLVVVPYGSLHYLPFHLLYTGSAYLVEEREIVVLPAAALAAARASQRSGARVLAHTWDGRLPHTLDEANRVHDLLGGEVYSGEDARRDVLSAPPAAVLHVAAHGQHRMDQPDLSYIHLADGQLYTDDLLQNDLSYELVTLSACETGRARVSPGDELIGLGRGFLYAGAGALIMSLWRVDDVLTVQFMECLYRTLRSGASKAHALREAQRALLDADPQLHPAFWGAFQLVGNPAPLSAVSRDKEHLYAGQR